MRLIRHAYLFVYNLLQFCGHTWILANMTARFLSFGRDSLADTFYSIGVVMSFCQLFSFLELFHILDGIEKGRLLPSIVQVLERNLMLFLVINMMEEIQSTPVVCVQFFLWNILGLLRYPHELLSVMGTYSFVMLWTRYTLWIPIYILSATTEGFIIYQSLCYFESVGNNSTKSAVSLSAPLQFPFMLKAYLPFLAVGASVTVWQLLQERKHRLEKWSRKMKRI